IDRIEHINYQDTEVFKLRITSGQIDYVHGAWTGLALSDVQTLRAAEAKSGMDLRLWDGGSGTSSMYFFNWDLADPKMRELIRMPKFRKAMSHAFNRSAVRKAIYFDTGELTSGTMSPKALEYNVPGGKAAYQEWRDSAIQYDPARAKALLAEIGLKDTNGDGFLEMADGTPIEVTLDYNANENPSGEHVRKSELLAKDWNAVGIKTTASIRSLRHQSTIWHAGSMRCRVVPVVGLRIVNRRGRVDPRVHEATECEVIALRHVVETLFHQHDAGGVRRHTAEEGAILDVDLHHVPDELVPLVDIRLDLGLVVEVPQPRNRAARFRRNTRRSALVRILVRLGTLSRGPLDEVPVAV
ncbi:MAG: hypothetical protein EB140_14635, partial [Proteobacteria bacterium]|nr:hypothetical protein [Pseudomonadota bacterium]